jgi:hypothetical protein
MGSPIFQPCSLALPGPCYHKRHPLRPALYPPEEPLSPAKLGIHRHSWSLAGHTLRPAQACTISTLQACAPKACQAGDQHTHDLCSTRPCPQAFASLHDIHPVRPRPSSLYRPAQSLLCRAMPPRPATLAIHTRRTSALLATPPQACMISTLPSHATKACQASDPQTFMIINGPAQASTISAGLCPSHLHRPARSSPGLCP